MYITLLRSAAGDTPEYEAAVLEKARELAAEIDPGR